jgi:hypothetical protein
MPLRIEIAVDDGEQHRSHPNGKDNEAKQGCGKGGFAAAPKGQETERRTALSGQASIRAGKSEKLSGSSSETVSAAI